MSEIINNSRTRVDILKKLLLDLHNGISIEETNKKLTELMGSVPYGEVVQAEQELLQEGMKSEDIQKYCDIHSHALKGSIDQKSRKSVEKGHPVHTFSQENKNIQDTIDKFKDFLKMISNSGTLENPAKTIYGIQGFLNSLMDLDKHYIRKENLLFPFLEKYKVTGPPKVMWGKDDEVRSFLKSSQDVLKAEKQNTLEEIKGYIELLFEPTISAIEEMIYKEENILFPMCLDTLTEIDWYEIYKQSDEIGYCLYEVSDKWEPSFIPEIKEDSQQSKKITLSTGAFTKDELESVLNSLPFDMTFVDKNDKVRYFSGGKERVFQRSKAILGRLVQYCHPPSSVHIVEQILNDFKSGKQDSAKFWINFQGKFVLIAYYAVRDTDNSYIGTLEVTQDITDIKKIEGEQRLLTYEK